MGTEIQLVVLVFAMILLAGQLIRPTTMMLRSNSPTWDGLRLFSIGLLLAILGMGFFSLLENV